MTVRFLLKTILSALVIAFASELSARSRFISAILISLPLTSILALTWMHVDGQTSQNISQSSKEILLFVLPSLVFFIVLSQFLNSGFTYWPALVLSCLITGLVYTCYVYFRNIVGL